jgi:uncharacterized membrane protein YeaQ/YmgE (transglycosylase-associated protein family)
MDGVANIDSVQFASEAQRLLNDILVWIGFGTVVGLMAKAIMPGRDPGGAIATLAMGIGGSIIGCGILSYFYDGERITPISPLGMLVAIGGAFFLLFFYRLLGGYFFVEGEYVSRSHRRSRRAPRPRRRAYDSAAYED